MSKNVLVTGGAGFIGSHLVDKLLDEGNKVIVIDNFNNFYDPKIKERNIENHYANPNYKLYRIDISDQNKIFEVFKNNKIDMVVHLAACAGVRPSIVDPVLYEEVNCKGSINIFEAMRKYNVKKIVAASSSSVYGNSNNVPFKESDQVDYAISPYAATKKANEVMGHVFHHLYNIDIIFLRFFTVYGPRQRPDLAINKFVRLINAGEEIPMFGDGTTSRDYTYILDIVSGIISSINYVEKEANVYEIINLGSSSPISLKEMIDTIAKELKKPAKINKLPMQAGDVDRTFADISKANKLLNYKPKMTFAQGIHNFIEWSNANDKYNN